jgi:hypothetical protein
MISDYRNVIFDENQIYDTYVKRNSVIQEKMIEFVKLKVLNLESYVLNLRDEEERWLSISIRNRSSSSLAIENSSTLNVLAQLTAKDVLIRIIQQSILESTSLSSISLISLIEKRSAKDNYSDVESLEHLLKIDQISIDFIALSKSDRDIDSADFNVANIVEKKRARKQSKKFVNFVMITSIRSSHRDSLSFVSKHWRDMKRHSHSKKFEKIVNFEYQILVKMKTFIVIFKSSNQNLILLMRVFTYKFDLEDFLLK